MALMDGYKNLGPYYDLFVNWESRLAREIPFILEVGGGAGRALDIGCGTGRHLKALQRAGWEVSGTEPSDTLRKLAAQNAPQAALFSEPMERLAFLAGERGPWDLVLCLGNTLPHLPVQGLGAFCRGLSGALAPGGAAVIHLLNYEKILLHRPPGLPVKKALHRGRQISFHKSYDYSPEHIDFLIEVREEDRVLATDHETLYPLTGASLREGLESAGLCGIVFYGDYDTGRPYVPESDNLVAVASKSPQS